MSILTCFGRSSRTAVFKCPLSGAIKLPLPQAESSSRRFAASSLPQATLHRCRLHVQPLKNAIRHYIKRSYCSATGMGYCVDSRLDGARSNLSRTMWIVLQVWCIPNDSCASFSDRGYFGGVPTNIQPLIGHKPNCDKRRHVRCDWYKSAPNT